MSGDIDEVIITMLLLFGLVSDNDLSVFEAIDGAEVTRIGRTLTGNRKMGNQKWLAKAIRGPTTQPLQHVL